MLVEILPCTSLYQPWRSRKSQRSILCFCETCETYECGVANLDIVLWTSLDLIEHYLKAGFRPYRERHEICATLQYIAILFRVHFDIFWPFLTICVQHCATLRNVLQRCATLSRCKSALLLEAASPERDETETRDTRARNSAPTRPEGATDVGV